MSSREEESKCLDVLDKIIALPEISGPLLKRLHDDYLLELQRLGWIDVSRWIDSLTPPYRAPLDDLAQAAKQAHAFFGSHYRIVNNWNEKMRAEMDGPWRNAVTSRGLLCGFSSAVDASRAIESSPWLTNL